MSYYRKGRNYELFIRKVFNCKSGKRFGADEGLMIKLFLNELGKTNGHQRMPVSRELFKVKMCIERALIKSKKKKKYINASDFFMGKIRELHYLEKPEELMKVVMTSFKKVIELENKHRTR